MQAETSYTYRSFYPNLQIMKIKTNSPNSRCRLCQRPLFRSMGLPVLFTLLATVTVHRTTWAQVKQVAPAQQTITGIVHNEAGKPLEGVTVSIKGSNTAVVTGADGSYTITTTSAEPVLLFKYVGMADITQPADHTGVLNITFKENVSNLNDIVVVGYGTKKKATLTGAVSTVDSKIFQDRGVVSNPLSALQGQVPGVIVTRSSAAPGKEGWSFQMRGATSTNGTDPLVVVDGIPMVGVNALNSINPQDIDNMSFLKDAAAAIYGARAAGGVVLITTKRARSGVPSIQYNGSVSQKRMGLRPTFLTGDQYGKYMLQAISNASPGGVADEGWIWTKYARAWINRPDSLYIDKTVPGYVENIGFTDVKDYTFFNTNPIDILWGDGRAVSTQQDLSLSAGNDRMGYRFSLGYMDDGSMLKWGNNSNKRYNIRFAYDYKFSSRLKISTNFSYEKNDIIFPTRQDQINYGSQPGFPVATKNGHPYAWGTQSARNWLLQLGGDSKNYTTRLFLNTKLDFNLAKDLNLVATVGYNWTSQDIKNQYRSITNIYNYAETYQYQDNPTAAQSWYQRGSSSDVYYNTSAYLEYRKKIKEHQISATAGVNYEKESYDYFTTTTNYLANDDIPSLSLGLGDNTTRSNNETINHWAIASAFGRFNYSFKEKYLFEANLRYDGSSKFDADHRWKFYKGLSAGWRLTQESFMRHVTFFNELKLRGSYGTVGNQSGIGYYDYIQLINLSNAGPVLGPYTSRSVTAGPAGTLVSLNRTWETVENKNLGVDFTLLHNHITGTFEYFWKRNKNMLLNQTYTAVLGAAAPTANIGELKTWGWEVALGWKDRIGKLSYYVNGTLTDNQNKLVHYGGRNIVTAGMQTIEGYPLNSYFGLQYNGRIQNDKEVADYARLVSGNSIGMPAANQIIKGINMYKDINGDGTLTNAGATQYLLGKTDANGKPIPDGDVVYLGSSDPRYVFALNLGGEWKGFDFSVVLQGVGKRNIYRRSDWSIPFGTIWQGHANWWVGKTWTPENPNAELPILTTANNGGFGNYGGYNYQISDCSMQSGAYMRLKNIVIGYTLPQTVSNKLKLQRLRVYFSGNDLWEITKVQDKWDPEQTNNISSGAQRYPFYRMITFGVNATF